MRSFIIRFAIGTLLMCGTALPFAPTATAQPKIKTFDPITRTPERGISRAVTAQHTTFDPARHGFQFSNSFTNIVELPVGVNIRTYGLCGGMAYAALDYFFKGSAIPNQDYRPANHTPLQRFLYDRCLTSITSNWDKWAELILNPGGARNNEFFEWGLKGAAGGRIAELRSFIDKGVPVPLGLLTLGGGLGDSHYVVAIGYDMGRYKGDLKDHKDEFRIFVYDVNHPNQRMTLKPNLADKCYDLITPAGAVASKWRTYFVDTKYKQATPPNIPNPNYPIDGTVRELILEFATGADDLRGGNDNVNLTVRHIDGTQQSFTNINLGASWPSNYTEFARVVLTKPVKPEQIKDLVISTTFGGGFNGDNWDMKSLNVRAIGGGFPRIYGDKAKVLKSIGFYRFTGDRKELIVPINPAPPTPAPAQGIRLDFTFRTSDDDLRGGNDNLNIEVTFTDGRQPMVFNNVNKGQKWANYSTNSVSLSLPAGVTPAQIKGIKLSTTFMGGFGGDNWNMQSVEVRAVGTNVNSAIANHNYNRFTGSNRELVIK